MSNKGSEERECVGDGIVCVGGHFRGSLGLDWVLKDKQRIYRHKGEKGRPRSKTMEPRSFLLPSGTKAPP